MALGAEKWDVFQMVIGQGLRLALAGTPRSAQSPRCCSPACSPVFRTLLFGVSASDPITFLIVSVVLTGVALLACYVPARRAMRVDPMVALRYE